MQVCANPKFLGFIDLDRTARATKRLFIHVAVKQISAVENFSVLISYFPPVRVLFAAGIRARNFYREVESITGASGRDSRDIRELVGSN